MAVLRPIEFRGGPVVGFPVLNGNGCVVALPPQIPLSFRRMFATWRQEGFVDPWYAAMTPKLRRSVNRIYGFLDTMQPDEQPIPTRLGLEAHPGISLGLPESSRCGFQAISFSKMFQIFGQASINNYWIGLAGLHEEEYLSRAYSNQMASPTSDFRLLCKYFSGLARHLQASHQDDNYVIFSRVTKNWCGAAGNNNEGVMTRMSSKKVVGNDDWVYLKQSLVVISVDEYKTAVEQHPELCEELTTKVMGRKPVEELLSQKLLEEESMSTLSSTPEGRAKLDKLADIVEGMFSFLPIRSKPSTPL
eukprot:CAMPEP_0181303704 /NCGR_PEP_ID=MMETSP1101-20121128/8712_1 /TAXON_ID=46948 /ORGANISM="Rhodomonas abbreviata, Strain Caron Lab Isolate" /LENGTH=303 /DNA_ID=CAMNT_0023409319 /DNA_START=337 /DNA_END=1248 /DNA_ORIENTATION=-